MTVIFLLILCLALAYMFYRLLPVTTLSILGTIIMVGWICFGQGGAIDDHTANIAAAVIVVAFVVDVCRKFSRLFER